MDAEPDRWFQQPNQNSMSWIQLLVESISHSSIDKTMKFIDHANIRAMPGCMGSKL